MPNWPEDQRRRNVYGDVYGQSLPMPGQTQPQSIPSLADLATLVNQQQPQQSRLPSPNFQPQQPAAPSLSQLQPPLVPQAAMSADTPASNQPKPAGFGRTLLDLGGGLVETARGLPAVVASQLEGVVNPGLERDWKDRVIEENRKRQQADIQALRDSGEYSRPMGLGIPMTRGEWAETTQSFPYTAATMGPAILGGIAGSAIGGAIGGLGGPAAPATVPAGVTAGRAIGSTLGGMLGAYIPAGRSAANQFIRDSIDQYQTDFKEKNGREPSAEETGAYYKATIEPNAVRIYHGEAAPEAAGTVAELGLMKSAIGDILHGGGSLPVRAAKAAAKTALSAFVVEPGTETATQQIQQPAYAATGLTNEKPRSLSSVDDWLKSAGEVYKQAAATSLFFSALGIPAGSVYGRHLANQEGKARASDAEQATAELRTNLEFARESDIAEALSRFDEIENAGRLPKSAAQRIDAARQQLLGELSLRVSPESISAPMNSQRGMAGYLGFSERVNELDDAQLADLAGRVIPENAEPTLADAAKRYQAEIGRRQALTDSAAHFEQNPDAVAGVAKALDDIATGKPMSKGAHGSTSFNLASLSDDMLRRYQLAGEVLLRDHSEALGKQSTNVGRSLSLLNEESQRRADGQARDPEAIREADLAERAAAEIAKGKKPNIKGLSFETLERMASGLEARASLEPRLADSARMLRDAAQQGRMRAFNPQGQQQPGIQSAMRGWNSGQPEAPAQPIDFTQDRARLSELAQQADVTSRQRTILDQEAQRRATREQQRVALAVPQGFPTITPAAIPQSLGRLGQTRLGNGVDQLPIPAQPQPSTPNVTESQIQGRQETSPMGLPSRPTGASQGQARGTPEQAASALLRQVPGRLGEQARLNHERVRQHGWQAFGPDTGTLGIPRADMPQVKAEHRGALVNFLNARGVAHEQDEEVDPTTLKPTQAEFSPKKVQQANEYQGGNRSILVSSDGHVVDGHHQWLSALSKGEPIKAIRLDAPIADLLPLVKEFPSATESKATTQPHPEQRREERQAEAAPLLSQEAEKRGNAQKPKAKGVAPTWNDANEIERAAMISRSSEKAGAPVSNAFSQRKAVEWKTWADIPEGPAKKRLRDYMTDIGKAENAPNRTESQGKEPDKNADKIDPSTGSTSKQNGATDLAERVRAYFLTSLRPLTPNTFWGMADNAFGGTQAQGAYNSKDAYDAMELGLNLALLDKAKDMPKLTATDVASVKTAVDYLESLQSRLPTQTRRDDEQQRMQQFSTPHTHSHVAAWVANITQNDEVLEPTAGTGNLVTHARLFGPERIVANELSKRRDALLRQISGVRVLNENANHLNAILPADVKPTVVLMNPPFSADISKVGKKDLDVGAIHVEQALQRLQPGGRLVAIVGRGMAMDTPRFSKWWNDIEKQYNVRADVGISGKEYTKFGTSFDNRMMVIDKTGPTESRSNIVRGQVDKVSDLVDLLQGVRNDRQTQRANADQQPSAIPASETGAPNAPREAEPGATVPAATGPAVIGSNAENRPRGPTGSARRTGRATAQPGVATADTQSDNSGAVPATPEQPESPGTRGRTAAATAGQPESQRTDAEPVSRVEIEARGAIAPTDQKGFGESRFDAYSPSVSIKNAKPHPTQLAESGAMASVSFPKLTYAPKLPADIIKEGRLSDAQLETIAYAGQSHEMLLPNGERRGFFVGDGCVAAGTRIYDPLSGKHRPIETLVGKTHWVLSLTADGLVPHRAVMTFKKGIAALYRVRLADREITVTDEHRFLTPEGWATIKDGVSTGHLVAAAGPLPHASSYVQRALKIDEGSMANCSSDSGQCDERLRQAQGIFQVVFPSQDDALERNRSHLHVGGLVDTPKRIRHDQRAVHLAKSSFLVQGFRAHAESEDQAPAWFSRLLIEKPEGCPQSLPASNFFPRQGDVAHPHQPEREACSSHCEIEVLGRDDEENRSLSGVSHRTASQEQSLGCLDDMRQGPTSLHSQESICASYAWSEILDIEFVRRDEFFDMYVPGPENYIAEGVINHNTGVGKGAQIAGIILDNWNQGRKKAVWISENARLFNDAQRDAEWVSLGKQRVFEQGKIKGEIGIKEGVAFTTYATLKSAERDKAGEKGKTRLDQLSDWLGKDFEGVIAFDEAHNMANAIARKGSRGVQQGSESARVGIELQKRFPKARVVYVSATGATEVHNLAYASRLGLWGEGTAFSNREAFIAAIHSGGLAAMEVVAKDTKSSGLYTARSLSYDGVEVETLQHELTTKQREMYDGMARAWQIVLRNVDAAMEAAQSNKNAQAKSSALSAFWGAHQRFFNAILTSLSAPSLINDVQSHLDNEHSVVMQLVNTNAATMERRMAQAADTGQELEELDLTPRDILMQYLQNSFPTTLYEEYLDEEGNTKTRPVMDAAGNVVQSPQALAARDRLQEQLATLDVPEGIIEQVINHFGSSQVAEITGRKRRLVRQKDGKVTEEKLGASKTKVDAADFDQGKKRILIFSDAGGTGRSYHADLRIPNQQKRIHYLVQPGWRADKAIQGLGRTHRTNQKQPPLVKLVTTTLKSQKRFISSIARRMDQMGALTKGQRDANSQGIFDDDANLENEYSTMALNALFHDIARGKTNGITVADIEREMGLTIIDPKTGQVLEKNIPPVQRFLNRLLSLESDSMNRVFDAFDTRRRAAVEYAKQVGAYDAGMESLVAESIKKVDDVVAAKHPMGGETRYVKLEAEVKNKIIDFDMLRTAGIQFAKSVKTGKLYAFEEAESVTNPETGDLITRRRRVSTTSTSYVRETDLKNSDHYEMVKFSDVGAMRAAWNDEIASTPKTRKETVHLIAGALLPIWDRLPMSSNRVIRAQTDSGERLIGRVIKNNDLSSTLRQLGVGVAAPKLDGKAALSAILDNHSTLVLSNGWRLMRRIVNGSPRVEVVPKEGRLSGGDRALLEDMGAFSEMVNWQFRTFLPTDNPGIVDRLFASKPLLEVVEPENRRSVPAASQSTGATISQARAKLVAALNERSVAALERSGKLILHRTDPTRTGAAGYVDPQGAIHLIPSNMDQDALSVALHEAMHLARDDRFSEGNRAHIRLAHAALKITGLKNFIGNPGFSNLVQQLHRLAAEGNKTAIEALDKARREAPGNVEDEALAYLVQYADEKLPLVRRIIAAIRAALYRMGIKVKLTPADVRALALSALKARAKDAALVQTARAQEAFSQPTTETDAAEQDRLWQEFQAVRAQFQAKQASQSAFDRWFGKGVEGVNARNGKPLVLYHGTNNPEFNRWDESRSGQASQHPTAGLGFFMTATKRSAARYGSRLLELHAKIDNPYYMTDADLVSIEDTQDAARFRRKLQAQGYDAAVISAPGGSPYVVALRSNQVKLASNDSPTESEDFRYSRPGRRQPLDSPRLASKVLDDIGGVRSTLKPGERALAKANPSNFKQMLSDLSADTRPAWLGFLTRNMQLELAKEVLPAGPVAQFEKSAEQLDADESKMIQTEGFPVADRWQDMMRKDRAQADAVGRALYMSTWLGVDPRTKAKNGKQAEWVRAKAAYDALNPAAKQLYGDVLDFYQKQTDRMFMELDARIDRHSIPAPDKKAMRDQLRREFERVKQDGPYAPLMRFGDLTVFAEPRKAGDKPVFATFESVAEQRAFFDYLKREGYAPQLGVKMEEVVKRNLPQGDFVDDLAAAIDRTMSGPEAQIIKDSMYQLFLRSLPEQAIRKHFMHRKFVPGYSADALRTFATFARRSAKQVARLKHGDLMSDALNQMMKAVKSGTLQEPVAAGHLVNELDKTFQWAMAPTTAQWASKLTSLGFMWHLGASPAHLFLNLSQQAQVTAPWLAGELHGKMGFGSVASALLKANKDFIASNPFVDPAKRSATANKRRQALEAEFGGDLGRALTALEEAGKTDKTQTYSLAGLSEEDSFLWSKPYLRKAIQGASWFFHTAEVVNREASAIAAYRLGRRSGLNHDQAYDLARRAINESHFDYSPSNRARYMRSNVAKVLTLFKQYSLNISWQLGRNAYLSARGQSPEVRAKARTKLLGMLGMTAVMAGAAGMPFYGEVMWMLTQLMNATRDDDEPEKDADLEFRRLLDSAFSPTSSEAVRKGLINAFVGVDFSSRIKLGDLWWRSDNRDLSGRDAAYAAMEQALGPVAGLAVRGYSTIDELLAAMVYGENARGDSWRAMETSMPKMLKDISRSIRYMKEGATTYQGARILDPGELSTGAAVGQALGFAPAALADQYEINSAKMKIQTHILRQRRALLDTYAMARAQNDDEVKKAAIEDMRAFNKRYPTIAITRQTLLRSMTSRDRRKAEIEKSGGVALDRRLVDVL